VLGYLASPALRADVWHLQESCPVPGRRTTLHGSRGLVALGGEQGRSGRAPCPRCAYDVVLVAAGADGRPEAGWHALTCDPGHERTGPCWRCAALARYSASQGAMATTCRGAVAVLLPGAGLSLDRAWLLMIRMGLSVRSAPGCILPAPSARAWASAAELLGDDVLLSEALVLAAALHAAPAHT